ncbi:hypothetical protein BKA70DRAFT_1214251 [Coprinopsis sp. MPI-PUGE-AT-0042]|nr:hypothetical protein BKA70DRAFT_1214251 [Coprinopsis sp. MPI-PUGE-AT-0042]
MHGSGLSTKPQEMLESDPRPSYLKQLGTSSLACVLGWQPLAQTYLTWFGTCCRCLLPSIPLFPFNKPPASMPSQFIGSFSMKQQDRDQIFCLVPPNYVETAHLVNPQNYPAAASTEMRLQFFDYGRARAHYMEQGPGGQPYHIHPNLPSFYLEWSNQPQGPFNLAPLTAYLNDNNVLRVAYVLDWLTPLITIHNPQTLLLDSIEFVQQVQVARQAVDAVIA